METAPKDGTPIRLFSPDLFSEDFNPSGSCEAQWVPDFGWQGATWNAQHDCWNTTLIAHPTHWLPLPPAPKTEGAE